MRHLSYVSCMRQLSIVLVQVLVLLVHVLVLCTSTRTALVRAHTYAPTVRRFVFPYPEDIPPPPFCNTFVKITAVVPPLV